MLDEDYAPILDDEAKRILGNIQHNAKKMGILIDDLLSFSRLGRKEIHKTKVNSAELVGSVLNEIASSGAHNATININSLPPVYGDYGLLRQV